MRNVIYTRKILNKSLDMAVSKLNQLQTSYNFKAYQNQCTNHKSIGNMKDLENYSNKYIDIV